MGQKARHENTFIFTDFTQIIETGYLYLLCEIKTGGFSTVAILMPPINTQSNIFIFILNCVTAYDSTGMLMKIN